MFPLTALGIFGTIGTPELIIILIIVVLLFGASKLPQLGGAVGKTIRSFKQELKEGASEGGGKGPDSAKACAKCGAAPPEDSTFCPKCGEPLR
jgi:sec-independent protein translocase protein TatA